MTAAEALLDVRGVDVSYGALQVLFDVSISAPDGGRVALLGTNGAGKSTLLKAVSGLVPVSAGSIHFDGDDITTLPADQRVERGIVQVAGGSATFPTMTVLENLQLGGYRFGRDTARTNDGVERVLDMLPAFVTRLGEPAGVLSGGEQQMMVIGRALIAEPRLLIIDELSLGLAPVIIEELLRVIDRLVDEGVTMLVVEQSLNVAIALTNDAYFMEKGEIRFQGPTSDLLDRGDLVRSVFFGEAHREPS